MQKMHKEDLIKNIGDLAVRALIYELSTTPKPGLVDKENNGAHRDMDYEMFKKSAYSLRECFQQCVKAGIEHQQEPIAFRLRRIGLAGEKKMFAATGGVNTHRGLIFSLGIICAACGILGVDRDINAPLLQKTCAKLSREVLEVGTAVLNTHGNQVYAKTGIYGAKGEALSGFNTAFSVGLPSLRGALAAGLKGNDAMVVALLNLMANTDDSNVVYRGGTEGLEYIKSESERILRKLDSEYNLELVRDFDKECIRRNLSPGGSADLLAVSAMLHMILEEDRTW